MRTNGDTHTNKALRLASAGIAALTLALVALVADSPGAGADQPQLSEFTLTGPAVSPSNGNTTFTWTLAWSGAPHHDPEDDDVSHVLINTCLGNTAVSSNSTGFANPDGHGDIGYKWETAHVGDTFSITFPGTVPSGGTASAVIAKAGNHNRFSTGGPRCDSTETTTTTAPPTTTTTVASTTTTAAVTPTTVATATTTTTAAVLGVVVVPGAPRAGEPAPAPAPEVDVLPTELARTGASPLALALAGAGMLLIGGAMGLYAHGARRGRRAEISS